MFASQSKNLFEYQIMLGLYENILIINIACKHDQFSSIVIHTVILKAVPVEFGDDKLQKWWTHVKYFWVACFPLVGFFLSIKLEDIVDINMLSIYWG